MMALREPASSPSRLPPSPPPPPPINPWEGRVHIKGTPLISNSVWPQRLLHVPSMTSYVREGTDTYNGVKEPMYNVLSYTWGRYQDRTGKEAPLRVHGVHWPIPSIEGEHFSAVQFKNAIELTACGSITRCEWVWVDVACIPQEHIRETTEETALRDQEIGRQVEIFGRAREVFVWLSSLRIADILENGRLTTIDDILESLMLEITSPEEAETIFCSIKRDTRTYIKLMNDLLKHPWFTSLWTLQEMVLRPDAWILFDDGLLSLRNEGESICWSLRQIKGNFSTLRLILRREPCFLQNFSSYVVNKECLVSVRESLEKLLSVQESKGLDASTALFPHAAYSIAQGRSVTRQMDRIHGIVQIYGISCNPNPPGDDDASKLHNLEDEFGMKLVAKAPLMSQLFIHSTLPQHPRRSWLISQKCKVGDGFWTCFTHEYKVEVLGSIGVPRDEGILKDFSLRFEGKGWNLDDFTRVHLFVPFDPLFPERYRGLMLDNHISEMVLGGVVDYFETESSMNEAIHKLYDYYCHDDLVEPSKILVALLGSSCMAYLPVVEYVALVLAPTPRAAENSSITDKGSIGEAFIKGRTSMIWKRIGLMRWTEVYTDDNQKPHGSLPTPQHFKCNIH